MGLREAKKQKVRDAIIENAIALFLVRGFGATPVREICERCEISDATFFNYFPTKDAVLNAWTQRMVAAAFDACEAEAGTSLRRCLRTLAARLAAEIDAEPGLARLAWVHARVSAPPPESAVRLLRGAQSQHEIRADIPAVRLAGILSSAIAGAIAASLADGERADALAGDLRVTIDLILDGARRRNERVRVVARAGARPVSTT